MKPAAERKNAGLIGAATARTELRSIVDRGLSSINPGHAKGHSYSTAAAKSHHGMFEPLGSSRTEPLLGTNWSPPCSNGTGSCMARKCSEESSRTRTSPVVRRRDQGRTVPARLFARLIAECLTELERKGSCSLWFPTGWRERKLSPLLRTNCSTARQLINRLLRRPQPSPPLMNPAARLLSTAVAAHHPLAADRRHCIPRPFDHRHRTMTVSTSPDDHRHHHCLSVCLCPRVHACATTLLCPVPAKVPPAATPSASFGKRTGPALHRQRTRPGSQT
jgi:hypothetical protein